MYAAAANGTFLLFLAASAAPCAAREVMRGPQFSIRAVAGALVDKSHGAHATGLRIRLDYTYVLCSYLYYLAVFTRLTPLQEIVTVSFLEFYFIADGVARYTGYVTRGNCHQSSDQKYFFS